MTRLDELRTDLTRYNGRARAIPLLRLGQALAMEHWRLGPGQPIALPALDESVDALGEALDLLDRELPLHRQTASMLGWLLGARHLAHGGPNSDRERGVTLLEYAIGTGGPELVHLTMARLVLSQLLTVGALTRNSANPLAALSGSAGGTADLDRAEAVLQPLLDPAGGPAQIEQATEMARCLLELGAIARTLTGGITGLLRVGPAQIMQQAHDVQQRLARTARVTLRPDQFFFADDLARTDPLDRPGAVMVDALPTTPGPTTPEPTRGATPARPWAAAGRLRADIRAVLPAGGVTGLMTIIEGRSPLPDVDTVDRWVALGSMLAEARDAMDADHLLFAATLYLRSIIDSGGWADDSTDDVHAAAVSLAVIGDALLAEPPETLAAALRLATVLDERRPALRVRSQLSERFGL